MDVKLQDITTEIHTSGVYRKSTPMSDIVQIDGTIISAQVVYWSAPTGLFTVTFDHNGETLAILSEKKITITNLTIRISYIAK